MARPLVITLLLAATLTGCVKRTLSITTEPSGALVWLNEREVGRTPVDVEFVYYGIYDVRIEHEGYEPILTTGDVKPPLWDVIGVDFLAEILPLELRSDAALHYVLEVRDDDPAALVERARAMRSRFGGDGDVAETGAGEPADR